MSENEVPLDRDDRSDERQTSPVVERVARAICRAHCGLRMQRDEPEQVSCQVENGWDLWSEEARAAIEAYEKAKADAALSEKT